MIYNVVTVFCLAFLAIEALYVLLNVICRSRAERISFVRGFKNGKCAIIYIIALPLYWIGHYYKGKGELSVLDTLFDAVKSIIDLVVLKYDRPSVAVLMADNTLYAITVYICFALVGLNALLFTFSLVSQHLWVGVKGLSCALNGKSTVYIFGNTEENKTIYRSEKRRNRILVAQLSKEECTSLYMENVLFADVTSEEVQLKRIFSLIRHFERECVVILNMGNDQDNIRLCREIVNLINNTDKKDRELLYRELKVFVFGDAQYEGIYSDIVASASGCITYVNKYRKIAIDFIEKYPITQFMTEEHIDYSTSLVHPDVNVNCVLLGFGKTNQQIFLTSVANNQLVTASENGNDPKIKQVNYYMLERGAARNDKNLNHNYYRFENEMKDARTEEYLPLPDAPANEIFLTLDISSSEFYNKIYNIVSKPRDLNYIVIAFGSDLENIDMAQKLVEKREEWGLTNLIIFVKANKWRKEETFIGEKNCFFIGNDEDAVFNVDRIYGDRIEKMTHARSESHTIEYDMSENPNTVVDEKYLEGVTERVENEWYTSLSQIQRESNLYGILSLRSKLQMMGLDYCSKDEEGITPLTVEEYFEIYAGEDRPIDSGLPRVLEKPVFTYPLDFPYSRRRNLAVQEHLRWNSFMISKGFIPSDISQILTETVNVNGKPKYTDGKRFDMRRHGNLTTFDGLVAFRKMTAERDGVPEIAKDKIKYDYQLLDDAWWLLDRCGYAIVKRK